MPQVDTKRNGLYSLSPTVCPINAAWEKTTYGKQHKQELFECRLSLNLSSVLNVYKTISLSPDDSSFRSSNNRELVQQNSIDC